jgi:hypothetical protein
VACGAGWPARRRPARRAPGQRAERRGGPPRARDDDHRRSRDRSRRPGLDADAARRGPRRPGPGPRRAGGPRRARPAARQPRPAPVDPGRRGRGTAPVPSRLGALTPRAPARHPRWAPGPGRDDGHRQPLAGAPAQRLVAGAARLPPGAVPRGRCRALGLPSVRAGTAPVHRTGARPLPDGWSRPALDAQVAVHPRGGMPLLVTPLARSRS